MGAFEYAAYDKSGKQKKGVLEGDSARQIRQKLREQNLYPISVDAVIDKESGSAGKDSAFTFKRGISAADMALMTRQLATLTRCGLPLDEATGTVARQSEKPRLKSLLMGVRSKIMEGHTLADGLGSYPHVFPDLYRATVAAGETSGHLDAVLERLADYTESKHHLSQRIKVAMFYPAILTVMAVTIVIGLLTYVVPQIVEVFDNTGQELPAITRALIGASDFIRENFLILLGIIIAAVMAFISMNKNPVTREKIHLIQLKLPIISKLVRGVNTARFSRTLSILVASNVSLLEAMRIASQVLSNIPMQKAVADATEKVKEGASLAKSLEQSGYFPPMMSNLIASGEVSGNLEEMLERASLNQEKELDGLISAIMGMLEPMLILIMGGVVLIIVLAILLPIFDMNNLVG
ncbi:MAG: type II secretion system inner membrane protein GspF [Thiohalomonadales bacterium]